MVFVVLYNSTDISNKGVRSLIVYDMPFVRGSQKLLTEHPPARKWV